MEYLESIDWTLQFGIHDGHGVNWTESDTGGFCCKLKMDSRLADMNEGHSDPTSHKGCAQSDSYAAKL